MALFHDFVHAALLFVACIRAVDASGPVVDLGYARYQGVVDTTLDITAFRGIRYAAAPTGKHEHPLNLPTSQN
jgi:hypothetical protein